MPDFLFTEPVLSPLASRLQDILLFRRRRNDPPIKNDDLQKFLTVDARAIRAAATELTLAGVLIVNDMEHGYEITTDKAKIAAQNARDRKAALSLLMKCAKRTRTVEHDENYSLEDEYQLMIQESISETAETLK